MALPTVPPAELARRLQITYPGGPLDSQIDSALLVAMEMLAGHVDDVLANTYANTWRESVLETAVKLWDAGAKGLVGMDAVGEFTFPAPSASADVLNSTKGLWAVLSPTGGNVIA